MLTDHLPQRLRVAIAARHKDRYAHLRVADAVGVSQKTVMNWMRGVYRPDANQVERICSYLQIPKTWLLAQEPIRFWPEVVE